jgi:hypothetical protein
VHWEKHKVEGMDRRKKFETFVNLPTWELTNPLMQKVKNWLSVVMRLDGLNIGEMRYLEDQGV